MKVHGLLRSMKIAFICFSEARGGLELMLVRIAAALQEKGHTVHFVCHSGSPIHDECVKARLPHLLLSPSFKYFDPRAAMRIAKYFAISSVQAAVVGTSKDISTAVLAKILHGHLRLLYLQQMQSGLDKRDFLHRWTYHRLDRWVTLTRTMRDATIRTTIMPPDSIDVIPFGADLRKFRPRPSGRLLARRFFQLPAKKKIIAVLGRFDPQKGQEYFLSAAPLVRKILPNVHFVLVGEETRGEPGYLQRLQSIVHAVGLEDQVQFLPFTEEVPKLLSAFDLVVLPSFSETFGYLAVEAMAMGLPVIGTNAGGLPEIIEEGKTGFLVPPKDSGQLAERIVEVLQNKQLYRMMSQRARTRAARLFDFRKNVASFEHILDRLTA